MVERITSHTFDRQSTEREMQPSDLDVCEASTRKGMDHKKTEALIGRGNGFGKMRGTCP